MIKLTLRGMLARRLRSALTAAAVLLGVTVISGTLVFTDTIDHAVARAVTDAARGADVVVSGQAPVDSTSPAPTVSAAVLARIQKLPDVERAQGEISDHASIVGADGTIVTAGAGGTRALSFVGPPFQAIQIVDGRPPRRPHEVVVDQDTAALAHYQLNQRIRIATLRPTRSFKIVGLMRFGGASHLGTTVLAFDLAAAQHLFQKARQVDSVDVEDLARGAYRLSPRPPIPTTTATPPTTLHNTLLLTPSVRCNMTKPTAAPAIPTNPINAVVE